MNSKSIENKGLEGVKNSAPMTSSAQEQPGHSASEQAKEQAKANITDIDARLERQFARYALPDEPYSEIGLPTSLAHPYPYVMGITFVIFGIILFWKFGGDALHSGSGSLDPLFVLAFALPIIIGAGMALARVLRVRSFKAERAKLLSERRKIIEQNNIDVTSLHALPGRGTGTGTGAGMDINMGSSNAAPPGAFAQNTKSTDYVARMLAATAIPQRGPWMLTAMRRYPAQTALLILVYLSLLSLIPDVTRVPALAIVFGVIGVFGLPLATYGYLLFLITLLIVTLKRTSSPSLRASQVTMRRNLVPSLVLLVVLNVSVIHLINIVVFYGVGPWSISIAQPGSFSTPSEVARRIERGGAVIGIGLPKASVADLDSGKCNFSQFPGNVFNLVDVRGLHCNSVPGAKASRMFGGGDGYISTVTIWPDWQFAAVGLLDGGTQIRRMSDWSLAYTIDNRKTGRPDSLSYSSEAPQGKILALSWYSVDARRGWVELRRAEDGSLIRTVEDQPEQEFEVELAPNGKTLAVGTQSDVRLYDVASGERKVSPKLDEVGPGAFAFSPDSQVLATSGAAVKLWSLADGKLLRTLDGGSIPVFSEDGKMLAVEDTTHKGTIKIWQTATGASIDSFAVGTDIQFPDELNVHGMAFSRDGRMLAVLSGSFRVEIWQVGTSTDTPTRVSTLNLGDNNGDTLFFSPDDKTLAVGTEHGVQLWDLSKQQQ